jgi:hypothetical protein
MDIHGQKLNLTASRSRLIHISLKPFYEKALKKLKESCKDTSFSISEARSASGCEFNFDEIGFVQLGQQ